MRTVRNIFALIIAACICRIGLADDVEVPAFKAPPLKYTSQNGTLLAGDRSSMSLTFWLNVEGANGHQCSMAGAASSGDNETYRFVHIEPVGNKLKQCVLDIVLVEHSAVLIDSEGGCHDLYCGARAFINGTVLHRVGE